MMTPFGKKCAIGAGLKVSHSSAGNVGGVDSIYLRTETGTRGQPSAALVDQICVWMGLIWDDAEELKRLALVSHPKPHYVRGVRRCRLFGQLSG